MLLKQKTTITALFSVLIGTTTMTDYEKLGANSKVADVLRGLDADFQPTNFGPNLEPLWVWEPEEPRSSMFWKMGIGEDFKLHFAAQFRAMKLSEQRLFMAKYPEPSGWEGTYRLLNESERQYPQGETPGSAK